MKSQNCIAAGAVGVMILGSVVLARSLSVAFRAQDRQAARLTAALLSRTLEQAHRTADDLTQQAVLEGLAQTPGVTAGFISNDQGVIISDSDAAGVGTRVLPRVRQVSGQLVRHDLEQSGRVWGTFYLGISGAGTRRRIEQFRSQFVLWIVLLAALLALTWRQAARRERQLARQLAQALFERDQRQTDALRWQAAYSQALEDASRWTEACLRHVPCRLILLDAAQRVVASNWLGVSEKSARSSWHEFPPLLNAGIALERSLQQPGIEISGGEALPGMRLRSDISGEHTHTLIWSN
jgi:hypothetical protein